VNDKLFEGVAKWKSSTCNLNAIVVESNHARVDKARAELIEAVVEECGEEVREVIARALDKLFSADED
jgi:uncharacterized protein YbcI